MWPSIPNGDAPQIFRYRHERQTWVKPSGISWVAVLAFGSGGGGGSGAKRVDTTIGARGGNGGNGGNSLFGIWPEHSVPDVIQIAIGLGGNGGAGVANQSLTTTTGTTGDIGLSTFLYSMQRTLSGDLVLVELIGGWGGQGGTTTNASNSNNFANTATSNTLWLQSGLVTLTTGQSGATSTVAHGTSGTPGQGDGLTNVLGGGGAAGGSWANTGSVGTQSGGTAASGYGLNGPVTGLPTIPFGVGGTAGNIHAFFGASLFQPLLFGGGGGGAGIGFNTTTGVNATVGDGGAGGIGSGGGGGGAMSNPAAATNNLATGKGGAGGNGIVMIWAW